MIRRKRRADEEPHFSRPAGTPFQESLDDSTARPFQGIHALFIGGGVSPKRLQIWKEKIKDLGGSVAEPRDGVKGQFTHVLANDHKSLAQHKFSFSRKVFILKFQWIEDCLKEGRVLPCGFYFLEDTATTSTCITNGAGFGNAGSEIDQCASFVEPKVFEHSIEGMDEKHYCSEKPNFLKHVDDIRILNPEPVNTDLDEAEECERKALLDNEKKCERIATEADAAVDISGVNKHITGSLREMWDIYESVLGDEWRALTYRKAAIRLEKLPCKISSIEDVKHISGIGSSMIEKIKEILCTGQLQKLESLKADPQVQILQHLGSVWGVGPKLAQKLYQAGHRTVEDLAKESSLSQMARIGVKYYKDLTLRIPRDEVEAAEKYVRIVGEHLCPGICIRVAGSYRRGSPTCGDIDFLVTHPDGYRHRGFLVKLVEKLQSTGFVTEGLHCTDHTTEGTKKVDTFMGVGKVPEYQHYRRLDMKVWFDNLSSNLGIVLESRLHTVFLKVNYYVCTQKIKGFLNLSRLQVYPKEAYAFALVYFTGNDILNRKIRYAAQRKGYKLNDQGLYRRYGGKKGLSSTECIPCDSEEEVFRKIGFPYYEPFDRNL